MPIKAHFPACVPGQEFGFKIRGKKFSSNGFGHKRGQIVNNCSQLIRKKDEIREESKTIIDWVLNSGKIRATGSVGDPLLGAVSRRLSSLWGCVAVLTRTGSASTARTHALSAQPLF